MAERAEYWSHCPAPACGVPQIVEISGEVGERVELACCGARCVVVAVNVYGAELALAPAQEAG